MNSQTDFEVAAEKMYEDYVEAAQSEAVQVIDLTEDAQTAEEAHAKCAAAVDDYVAEHVTAAKETRSREIDNQSMRKLFIAARCLNEVLKPQMFKSDWRVSFEKKRTRETKDAAKLKHGGSNPKPKNCKSYTAEENAKYYGSRNRKRQKGECITDQSM